MSEPDNEPFQKLADRDVLLTGWGDFSGWVSIF